MIKITSTIVFFLLIISLWGQFDERSIMTQQATQLMARRQYAEAEQVFRQVLQKFPSDTNSVLQLLQICYLTSQIDKAEAILLEFNRTLPPQQYTEQMIQLYVMQGKPNLAWDLAQNYLSQNNHDQNRYRLIASYFERRGFYEQVLELYRNARIHNRNNDLFGLEYANTSLNYRLYRDAITEYLRFLDKNPANLYFVNNQIKTIIQEDSTMINVIGSFAMGAVNPVILELYATSLVNLKRFGEALEIYKSLSYEKLQGFATEQFTALNDDIAFAAYEHLISIGTNEVQKAETKYRLAQIRIRNADFASAHQILNDIINDQQLSDRNVRNRTTVNMNSRKMMAELILSTTAQIDSALVWYDAAKRFARNNLEATEIELEITKLLIMNEAYNAAAAKLKAINEPRLNETRDFYDLILALMQNEIARADSLMNEYVIKYPGSPHTNDSIYLMMLLYAMQETDMELFMQAYRKKQMHQKESIGILMEIFEHNKDEELRILAIEWALQLADKDEALRLLEYEWEDEIAIEYAALLKLRLLNNSEHEQRFAREFLKQNPNSIFSPNFRQVISRTGMNRPNL